MGWSVIVLNASFLRKYAISSKKIIQHTTKNFTCPVPILSALKQNQIYNIYQQNKTNCNNHTLKVQYS